MQSGKHKRTYESSLQKIEEMSIQMNKMISELDLKMDSILEK